MYDRGSHIQHPTPCPHATHVAWGHATWPIIVGQQCWSLFWRHVVGPCGAGPVRVGRQCRARGKGLPWLRIWARRPHWQKRTRFCWIAALHWSARLMQRCKKRLISHSDKIVQHAQSAFYTVNTHNTTNKPKRRESWIASQLTHTVTPVFSVLHWY